MQNWQIVMRYLQIAGFVLGLIAFLVSAAFIGNPNGDTFWKTGVGFMLSVITLNLLWPTKKK
jgi:hypothetical protein